MITCIRAFAVFAALFLLAGCASTADLTKNKSSTCEVHKCSMAIEVVDCVPGGNSCYRPEFDSARRHQFPNHGRIHYSEDYYIMYARYLRIYVCPECTTAFDKWIKENPGKWRWRGLTFGRWWAALRNTRYGSTASHQTKSAKRVDCALTVSAYRRRGCYALSLCWGSDCWQV